MKSRKSISVHELAFFKGLDNASLDALQTIVQMHFLQPREPLYNQGEMANAFYVVVRGGVRLVEHTDEGKAVNLKVFGQDDVFGLLAISGAFVQHAGIVAISPSEIAAFNGPQTRQIILKHPTLGLHLLDAINAHVHHAHSRIRHMAVEKTERRLARALMHFCEKFGDRAPDNSMEAQFTQQDIAEFTGTTIETVNRFFKQWQKAGYISLQRKQVRIVAPDGLRQIINEESDPGMAYLLE